MLFEYINDDFLHTVPEKLQLRTLCVLSFHLKRNAFQIFEIKLNVLSCVVGMAVSLLLSLNFLEMLMHSQNCKKGYCFAYKDVVKSIR